MTKSLFAALLAATALTACAAGPDYRPPVTPPTAAAPFIGTATPAVSTAEAQGDWWRLYEDPLLDRLVGEGAFAGRLQYAKLSATARRTRLKTTAP